MDDQNTVNETNELDNLKTQLAAETEAKLMALADLENYRKRMEKERVDLMTMANVSILRSLADLIDDFERMVSDLEDPNSEDKIDAFKSVLDKAKGILADYGVVEIPAAVGDKFDPAVMEAIGTTGVEADKVNTIAHLAQKGYRYNNKDIVIRHVRVIVGKVAN